MIMQLIEAMRDSTSINRHYFSNCQIGYILSYIYFLFAAFDSVCEVEKMRL